MSADGGSSGGESTTTTRVWRCALTLGVVLLCLVAAVAVSGAVAAQEATETPEESEDTESPTIGDATKGNLTTIRLTIIDDTDVDETSITADDFSLDPGNLDSIAVNESGTNATVELYLSDVVSSNNVTVSVAGGSISDAAGNTATETERVVTDMDGFRPQLQDFSVTRVNESAATIEVVSSERLSELFVGVGGPGSRTLTMANFTEVDSRASFEKPYRATVRFDEEGEFEALVGTMTDVNGVSSRYNVKRSLLVDRTPPTARIDAPPSATVGESIALDGTSSADEYGIEGYDWAVDGNHTASGESVNYTFRTPGYHGVTLTVTDRRNNSARRTVPILVESEETTADVTLEQTDAGVVVGSVGPNRTTARVRIARDDGLASTADLRLESLTVDVPVETNATLEFSATADVSTWFDTANTTALGGLTVEHDRSLSTATFRFSVNESQLAAAGVESDEVTLYRETDGWQSIYTTRVNASEGRVYYEATAGGLSRFVVGAGGRDAGTDSAGMDNESGAAADDEPPDTGGTVTGSPQIIVRNSTLLTTALDRGDRALVRAIAHNAGNATGTYRVGLVVNNTGITSTVVTVPPGENRTVTFAQRVNTGGTVVVNGTIAGTISMGGNATTSGGGGGLPIPNPLALWPGGLFGRVLGAVFWLVLISYAVLKGIAIYLGY